MLQHLDFGPSSFTVPTNIFYDFHSYMHTIHGVINALYNFAKGTFTQSVYDFIE